MDTRSVMRPSRPQSVKELVDQAENFNFNTNIPFKHWTRAAETLYQEVSQPTGIIMLPQLPHDRLWSYLLTLSLRQRLRYPMATMDGHT